MFCFGQNRFSMIFLSNLFKNLNLCTSYIKQIMNVFSFVQWYKYFHLGYDPMHGQCMDNAWTRLRLVEWNTSSFTSWKYLYHCTHKHSLFVYYTILYYTILYYTILYYTILYYTILYYTILYYTVLYYTNSVVVDISVQYILKVIIRVRVGIPSMQL